MISLGQFNHLEIIRIVQPGAVLGDNEGNEVLLPGKYIPNHAKKGDELDVFIYKDSEDRPVATTENPLVQVNEFAVLKVKDVNNMGAFLDWGLEKDLLVPFKQQLSRMEIDKWYLIYLYLDEKTNRLVATAKVNRYFNKDTSTFTENQKVDLLIGGETDLGINVVIDNQYRGLIFKNEIFQDVLIGDRVPGYIKKVREDQKLDVSLQPLGLTGLDEGAERILTELRSSDGFLPLHDKSSPEEIQSHLQMSKKNFKRSVGILYKSRMISLEKEGIRLRD